MERLAGKISLYFLKHKIISQNDVEVCSYALYRQLSRLLVGGLLIALGSFVAGTLPAIGFTISFLFLRESTGGYHAKSESSCVVLSCFVEFVLLSLVEPIVEEFPCQWLLMIGGCVCIVLLAPINDENIQMTDAEMRANAHRSRIRLSILLCFVVTLQCVGAIQVVASLQLAIFGVAASIVAAELKNNIDQTQRRKIE